MTRKHPLFLAALALLLVIPAQAAVFTPNEFGDTADGTCDSHCTLRDAVLAANTRPGYDVILLKGGIYRLALAGAGEDLGATGDLDIRDELAIVGDAVTGTIIEGDIAAPGWNDRVIDVLAEGRLEVQSVTVRQGRTSGQPGAGIRVAGELRLSRAIVTGNVAATSTGGGIHIEGEDAVATIVQSTIHGNQAGAGGGLYIEGTLNLTNSTVSGNRALTGSGGGLYFTEAAGGTLSNATIAFNSASNIASQKGGGIYEEGESPNTPTVDGPVLRNTMVVGNAAGTGSIDPYEATGRDCWGQIVSGGHNSIGDASSCLDFTYEKGDIPGTIFDGFYPYLLPLGEFGGPTPTHAFEGSNPGQGKGADCEAQDQRGATRTGPCDIGAFEETNQCVSGGGTLCLNDGRFTVRAKWRTNQSNGTGKGVQLTDESGYLWFFDPTNVELTIKVLDGCSVNSRYWVFVSGLTNVEVEVTVRDTQNLLYQTYINPLNTTFAPILDTNAFNSCP